MTTPDPDAPLASDFEPASRGQWEALVAKVLKGADFKRRLVSHTADGLEIQPLYTRADAGPDSDQAAPGAAPFTRGSSVRAAAGGWRIGQIHAERDPAALAKAIAEDIHGGAETLTIRFEAPGQTGLAADANTIEAALGALLSKPAPDLPKITLDAGAHAVPAGLALSTLAKQHGASARIAGLGIDPLGTLARTGELTVLRPDGKSFAPGLPWLQSPATTLLADARPAHEAGGSEAHELAALASSLVCYLRAAEAEGIAPASALPRISLAISADADVFVTIAKLRAARSLVWRIADACGAGDAAGHLRLAATTSERMMTRRDPWVNLLRATAACTAAAMGGADDITMLPHTWALGRTDGFARRIARNIGLVLREEASLGRVIDPAGGSFYVERLTADLAAKAWDIFQQWEAEGGMLAALTSGLVHDQIAAVAQARANAIATGRNELTGTTAFPQLANDRVDVTPWPAPPPLPATKAAKPLLPHRLAEPFERLRDAADAHANRPTVFLASLGTPAEHGARSTWIANFLATGGIGVIAGDSFTASADVGRAFATSGASIACLCASDTVYGELGEAAAMALKGAGARHVYLAGRPREQEAALKAAGIDGFIFAGIDALVTLARLHRELGVAGS